VRLAKEKEDAIEKASLAEALKELKYLKELKPKPLRVRIITLLKKIDSRIMTLLQTGHRDFHGETEEALKRELVKLAAEPGGDRFVKMKPDRKSVAVTTDKGLVATFAFSVEPALLVDEAD
jgi:hypothetical protein